MAEVIGLVTANYAVKHQSVLTEYRPAASLPYGGRYRAVDFALSNLVNAGIRTVGMVMPFDYRSLIDHLESGRDWALDRKNGGLFMLPGSSFGTSRTGSRFLLRDIRKNLVYLKRTTAKYVICTSASFVYNADLNELIEAHTLSGADITMLVNTAKADDDDVIKLETTKGRVKDISYGVHFGDVEFLDCFILSVDFLCKLIEWHKAIDYMDLFEAIKAENGFEHIDIQTFTHKGYAAALFNKDNYYKRSMELLKPEVNDSLFPANRAIKTKAHDNPPAKYEKDCTVHNTVISAGCRIYGCVSDSILGRDVVIEPGACVRNSIIYQGCVVKRGARVEHAIIDKNNVVNPGCDLRGTPDSIFVKEKGLR